MFRAEVVGSILPPPYLMQARAALEAGEIATQRFKRIEDRAGGGDVEAPQEALDGV